MNRGLVLGIWDGHDAGAALMADRELLFAVNEERLSRRKLEAGFPRLSIEACLRHVGCEPDDIATVAASTTDPAKTLTRLFPALKEEYYLIRRRKKAPGMADPFKKAFKYRFTEFAPNPLSRYLSRHCLKGLLLSLGFRNFHIELIDHHTAHARAAAAWSGFDEAVVFTLDGVGDGLSGSLRQWHNGSMTLLKALPARASLGIFFEHVTNLMNMRELEDEGKVMALASYAYPVPDEENPLLEIIGARGMEIVSSHNSRAMYRALKDILWRYPSEQFAAMAQRTLERCAAALAAAALAKTGFRRLAVAGGVFSNIKMNMKIAQLPGLERMSVFPHMGDGGLAIGAAIAAQSVRHGTTVGRRFEPFLGPAYGMDEIMRFMKSRTDTGISVRQLEDPAREAASLILKGEIILWFQGRMEIGPRALGHRSILARPDDRTVKDRLNLLLKKRVWYQPFCPSMLMEDAPALLEAGDQILSDNPFMTMGFQVRREHLALLEGVSNIDGTCRPHFVSNEDPRYRQLLLCIKETLGYGVVLNTSFNLHGEPMVCSPAEALAMLTQTGIRYLFMEDLLIENKHGKI